MKLSNNQGMQKGLVFDIKRYAINDGPGIRVVIFFKGCNLHCAWCHNPESISPKAEKMYTLAKCIRCGTCVEACPQKAIRLGDNGIVTNTGLCKFCGVCADVCPSKAIVLSGKPYSVVDLMETIEKERIFFDQSGGGVTFSGGEPLLHHQFLMEMLDECRKRGIHTAVDTAGNVNTKNLLEVAQKTDLFLFDLKMMDAGMHKKWVNAGNDRILSNLRAISEAGAQIIIRIPLIRGINDSIENLEKSAKYLSELPGEKKQVNLLPYHAIAQHKFMKLGRPESFEKMAGPEQTVLEKAIGIFERFGLRATVGG
jgi:pyruvate formate lyase activating enzyme